MNLNMIIKIFADNVQISKKQNSRATYLLRKPLEDVCSPKRADLKRRKDGTQGTGVSGQERRQDSWTDGEGKTQDNS